MERTWQDVIAIAIVTSPGIIAAVSSLRNGKKVDQLRRENGRTGGSRPDPAERPKKNGQPRNWFHP